MITEADIQEVIAEYQGKRNPSTSDCVKLAAFLTIQKEMFGVDNNTHPTISFSAEPELKAETIVDYPDSGEFGKLINGKVAVDMWDVMKEVMEAIKVTNPKIYNFAVRRLKG